MLPTSVGVEPATSWSSVGQASNWATEAGSITLTLRSSRGWEWYVLNFGPISIVIPTMNTRGPWWSYIAHLTKQICIFTVEVSAKFTALGFLYKLYSTNHPHPPPPPHPRPCFFYKSWRLELNLKRGSPKEHFCQVILKLVQWFKKSYIAIKPYALVAMCFDESWKLEQTW